MPKTQEELNELKSEYETLTNKLKELSDDELAEVTGGNFFDPMKIIGDGVKQIAEQVLKPLNVVSPEETLGGKIPVYPNDK